MLCRGSPPSLPRTSASSRANSGPIQRQHRLPASAIVNRAWRPDSRFLPVAGHFGGVSFFAFINNATLKKGFIQLTKAMRDRHSTPFRGRGHGTGFSTLFFPPLTYNMFIFPCHDNCKSQGRGLDLQPMSSSDTGPPGVRCRELGFFELLLRSFLGQGDAGAGPAPGGAPLPSLNAWASTSRRWKGGGGRGPKPRAARAFTRCLVKSATAPKGLSFFFEGHVFGRTHARTRDLHLGRWIEI